MSAPLLLSRATLRRDVPAAALRSVLLPVGDGDRTATAHRLVWTLFGDSPDRSRDFLWREGDGGTFYFLSTRPPEDRHGLFELAPERPYLADLEAGQRLRFLLRVNATVARGGGEGRRGKPCDIVMDALRDVPKELRAGQRQGVATRVARKWLDQRGTTSGFALAAEDVFVLGYRVLGFSRSRGDPMRIGVLDVEGTMEVQDPAILRAAVANGFGRAKAFGCGLLLARPIEDKPHRAE
jgi:CRISPR system Cascade subunit CasE